MANYVDYDYWLEGYGEGDLSQREPYVVTGYWDAGYAEYDDVGSAASVSVTATVTASVVNVQVATASVTCSASVTAKAVDYLLASASVTANATMTALADPEPYVETGYWVGGYCEYDYIFTAASVNVEASVSASGIRVQTASGAITTNAALEVSVTNVEVATAAIEASATVSAIGNYTTVATASVSGVADVTALGSAIFDNTIAISSNVEASAVGDIIGYEWSEVLPESNNWVQVGASYVDFDYWEYGYTVSDLLEPNIPSVWQQVSAGSTNWVRQ